MPRPFILLALAVVATPLSSRAAENRYDVFARTLAPIAGLFSGAAENKAARAQVTLVSLTGAPKELLGGDYTLAIQSPDRLFVGGDVLGERLSVCRDRQRVWAAPGSKFLAVLAQFEPLPRPEPGFTMGKFRLPLPPEQFALLAVLFVVNDGGEEILDGVNCRVLDLKPMPEIARSLKTDDWSARLWVAPDHKPARLLLRRRGWQVVLGFRDVEYVAELPDSQWKPAPGETDALGLGADRMSQIMQLIARELGGRRP